MDVASIIDSDITTIARGYVLTASVDRESFQYPQVISYLQITGSNRTSNYC